MKTIFNASLLFVVLIFNAAATPLAQTDVPDPLKPWINWVLYQQDKKICPHAYNSAKRFCAWPSALVLDVDNSNARFSQQWQVMSEFWVRLPGDFKQWPHNVKVNNVAAVVVNRKGFPVIKLSAGEYKISGDFLWDSIPQSLMIPPATGLVEIKRNGLAVAFPRIDLNGKLWLNKSPPKKNVQDTLELQVFRKIVDGHPMRVTTRLTLKVSGGSRNITFPRVLLDGFIALALKSRLPARVNQQGDLQIQVRPGNWSLDLTAYSADSRNELHLNGGGSKWPRQEVWAFEAVPKLRLVEVSGVAAIDPSQTQLPGQWHQYPAYLVMPGQSMRLKTLQRGGSTPEPNRLSLNRTFWMDFDGQGYTFSDRIEGTMSSGWRLVTAAKVELGSVRVDGDPRFITTLEGGVEKGVEVRRGRINLQAESRYTQSLSSVPVAGWKHDFYQVDSRLLLPPGWKLFSAQGADNVPDTWLQRWTLLDLFLVLVIAVAVGRLWGLKWGLFALITLVLIWPEPEAPQYIWLNLVAAVALLQALPEGRVKTLIWWYRNTVFLGLLLIVIPFIVSEVRNGIYPQLGLYSDYSRSLASSRSEQTINSYTEAAEVALDATLSYQKKRMQKPVAGTVARQSSNINQMVDPNANIQTGPGLPSWRWQGVRFNWNSPVSEGQVLQLNLITPNQNMALGFLRVILLLILISRMLQTISKAAASSGTKSLLQRIMRSAVMLILPLMLLNMQIMHEAKAETRQPIDPKIELEKIKVQNPDADIQQKSNAGFPGEKLLQSLRARLTQPDDCLPACAEIETMRLQLSEKQLTIYLKIHTASAVAVPLPGDSEQWRAEIVLLQNQPVRSLTRDEKGVLSLALEKGIHNVVVQGKLPRQSQFSLSLTLKPKYVEWKGEGWRVEGIRDNHIPNQQLQLIREKSANPQAEQDDLTAERNTLPALVRVQRTLHLGLDWTIETLLTRISPVGNPVSMRIPLLPGESVLSDAYAVKDEQLLINLLPNQSRLAWQSKIQISESLVLQASSIQGMVESWKLDISPIWHVEISGIAEIHQQNQAENWLPEWQPWPGESIQLSVTRPKGIEGRTLTIDSSVLVTNVGKRIRESEFSLNLRSSRGGQHVITLPEQAALASVEINNIMQPVRQNGRSVSLPIVPGKQKIVVKWRLEAAIDNKFNLSPVGLGVDSVNNNIQLRLGRDRWVLMTHGPSMGPVVLFWGVLIVVLIGAIILAKLKNSPLRIWQWFLLGVGLSLSTPFMILIVVGWLLALSYRPQLQNVENRLVFNTGQVLLIILTLAALSVLMIALQQGLLGWPDMQISGNSSNAWDLKWYQDRAGSDLPQPWVVSVPLFVYRILMLLWALWMAFSLIAWLRQGWQNFTVGGLWRPRLKKNKNMDDPVSKGAALDMKN